MSIKNRLIFAFSIILLLAVIPLIIFTLKVAPYNSWFLDNKNFEYVLENASSNANTPAQKERAIDALHQYRQLTAIGEPLKSEFIKFSIILACILFFIAMGIVFVFVNRITKPLQELTNATKRIAEGDISFQLKEGKIGEFNILIKSFNSMARALQEAQHRLVVAERHTAWREMARMLAHEIKNPLTPIQLSVQRLREKYLERSPDLPAIIDKTTQVIGQEVKHFVHLVDNFSSFAHLPSPSPKLVNINTIVKDSVDLYRNLPNTQFETNYDETIPQIMADPGQIKQALSNIIKNGIEACDRNCIIKVTTKLLPKEIEISITDNGKGMDKEDIERMFHPYFTTKAEAGSPRQGGVAPGSGGLGLVITERIITEHNGKISVSSKKREGTTVTIKIPKSLKT